MSKRSQEKRRERAKEKRQARRRTQGTSVLSRLAGKAEEACECWTAYAETENRMRTIVVYRGVRSGAHVGAYFLIDYDCIGLKDAFVRTQLDIVEERAWMREESRKGDVRFVRVTLEEVRREVAGAMHWTGAHPFRLPAELDKCLRVIEGVGEVESASVRDYGTEEGGIFYLGYEADLARRLEGVTLDEFLEREDVDFEFVDEGVDWERDGEFDEDDEEQDEVISENDRRVMELADEMSATCATAVRQWCKEQGVAPAEELDLASKMHVATILAGIAEIQAGGDDETARQRASEILLEMLECQESPVQEEVALGLEQIFKCNTVCPEDLVVSATHAMKARQSPTSSEPKSGDISKEE